jgi:hypothetical protein
VNALLKRLARTAKASGAEAQTRTGYKIRRKYAAGEKPSDSGDSEGAFFEALRRALRGE